MRLINNIQQTIVMIKLKQIKMMDLKSDIDTGV